MMESESKMKQYIVKTVNGKEQKVVDEMLSRLTDFGSMKKIRDQIGDMTYVEHMKGYIFVEAESQIVIEQLVGKTIVRTNILPMKNVKRVIGEVSNEEYNNYTKPKIPTDGLDIGTIATIQKGAFKGEQGIVLSKTDERVKIELLGEIPMIMELDGKDVI